MCGITGFIDFKKQSSKGELVRMTTSLAHRGPDGDGIELLDGPLFFSSDGISSGFPSPSGFPIPLAISSSVIELSDPGPVGL